MPNVEVDDFTFKKLTEQLAREAEKYCEGTLHTERERNWDYYHGRVHIEEPPEGRSKFVMREVSDSVDAALPEILDVFDSAGDKIVEFKPRGPEDVDMAEQATTTVNYIYSQQNRGFVLSHDFVKNGLIAKAGVFRVDHEEDKAVAEISYSGLNIFEVNELLGDEEIELVEMDFDTPLEEGVPDEGIDLTVKKTSTRPKYKVRCVAAEDFIIHESATDPDDALIIGERTELRVGDVVAMGYDFDEVIQHAGNREGAPQSEERTRRRGQADADDREDGYFEHSMRPIVYWDLFVMVDRDADGIPERYRCVMVGDSPHLIHDEPADLQPYAVASPFRHPNTVIGDAMADRVYDLQDLNTVLMRAVNDNANRVGNPRTEAAEGTNMDDLLDNKHGGAVRTRVPGSIRNLEVAYIGDKILPIVDYAENRKQQRTGLTRAGQGLDPDALQSSTQEGVEATLTASRRKVKLYAKIFGECGFAVIAMKILQTLIKHQKKDFIVEVNGKFTPMRPQYWHADLDVICNVGLGSGDREEQLGYLTVIAAEQKEILLAAGEQNPICSMGQLAHTLRLRAELMGFKDVDKFYNPPEQVDAAVAKEAERAAQEAGQPDPETQRKAAKDQAEIQLKSQKQQADQMLARQKSAAELAEKREEAAQKQRLQEREARAKAALARWQAQQQANLDRWKAREQLKLDVVEVQAETALEARAVELKAQAGGIGNQEINRSD